jgi:hypothetical protein
MTPGDYFAAFARCFTGEAASADGAEIYRPALLPRARLDYSVDSLEAVDAYLLALHELVKVGGRQETIKQLGPTVMWAGAYVGETIRRSAAVDQFAWVDYTEYVAIYPEVVAHLGARDMATCALLMREGGAMCVPIGKVLKLLFNGLEDSVRFFAAAELADARGN